LEKAKMTASTRNHEKTAFRARRARVRQGFTLLEVILGLGVLAFGVISLLALFPATLRASRDSLAETYAAESADQFLQFLGGKLKTPDGNYQAWDEIGKELPTSKPGVAEPEGEYEQWFSEGMSTFSVAPDTSFAFHRLERCTQVNGVVDFTAICRVWRTPVTITTYRNNSWETTELSSDEALGLNVEISWPAELPYLRRHKAIYHLDIFKDSE
jgi:Tfp pilus assembly protein PilV